MSDKMTIEDAQYIIETYKPIPHLFIKDMMGCKTWHMQDEIVISTFENKVTAVKTCNAVGKSFIAARIVLAYLTLLPGSIVVTTAPTWRQVTDILWREIATAVKMSKLKLTTNEIRQAGLDISKDWYAVGLSTKYPENFFGYHADNILVVVDEAGGVPEPIFKGVKAITPNANARILYIGNPTQTGGTFHQQFLNTDLPVKRFTISAFQSPNLSMAGIHTLEDLLEIYKPPAGYDPIEWRKEADARVKVKLDPTFSALIDPGTVYERYLEWGLDSPAWQALIMGEFPSQSDQALIPEDLVSAAMRVREPFDDTGKTVGEIMGWSVPDGVPEYGLDMARYGGDNTVFYPRHGGFVEAPTIWNKVSLMESADRVLRLIDPYDMDVRVNIDDTGNGGGTTDRLRQIMSDLAMSHEPLHQYQLVAYNFGSAPANPKKFHDITSELYWNLREWFMKKKISLPNDKQLYAELISRQWSLTERGLIKVESKKEYKKRTGAKSPDRSDALALAFAGRLRPATVLPERETLRSPAVEDLNYIPEEDDIKVLQPGRPITSGLKERF